MDAPNPRGARSDAAFAVLALVASALVLMAPVAGRAGYAGLANALMLLAAGAGLAGFGLAALDTFRAARRTGAARNGRMDP